MILRLEHQQLDVYKSTRLLVKEIYQLVLKLPPHERFGLCSQLRRASTSVFLNIAEGASRMTVADRRHFFIIARSSLVEIDTALQLCIDLEYLNDSDITITSPLLTRSFQMLSKMI